MNISSQPYFQNSVRTLFPLTALTAIIAPCWIVSVLINQYPFAHPFFNIFDWHSYEMLYGFLLTLIAGFILTAGGHWTGKGPLEGRPLVILLLLWFFDKFVHFIPMPNILVILSSAVFPLTFLYLLSKLLKGYRQYGRFMFLIGFISLNKILFLYSAIFESRPLREFAIRSTIWVVIALVSIIAGRVTPRFTQNLFKLNNDLIVPKWIEKSYFTFIILSVLWVLPDFPKPPIALAFTAAGIFGCIRLGFYRPFLAATKPILGMLHAGYFLFSFGLILIGLSQLFPSFDQGKASLHFLLTGGVSLIAMNIMVRASLGHTGRKIEMTPTIALIFLCISIGAFLRAFVPVMNPQYYYPSLHFSMGFWTLGFIFYFLKFFPIMLMKRADSN